MADTQKGFDIMSVFGAPQVDKAWRYVAITFSIALVSNGLSLAVGPLVMPLVHDFGFGQSYLLGIIAIRQLLYGAFLLIGGRLADSFGSRAVAVAGSLLLAVSLILSATTHSILLFIISFALLAPFGHAATGQTTLAPIVSRWFDRRRGLALTFISAGSMAGLALITPLLAALIEGMGWRNSYLALAVLILLVLAPAALFGLTEPKAEPAVAAVAEESVRDDSSWSDALKTRPFWLLTVSFLGCGISMNLLSSSGVPMLESHGFGSMTASFGIGLMGLLAIFGSLALGALSDRFGRKGILALIYAARGVGFLGLMLVASPWQLYFVTITTGLIWSGTASLTTALITDTYGPRWVGTLYGWMYLLHQIGGALASYLAGWSSTHQGSFSLPFGLTVFVLFVSAFLSYQVPERRPTGGAAAAA